MNIKKNDGFTIIEILIVIVVIGILATITVVSYRGITGNAAAAVLKGDVKEAAERISLVKASDGVYPASVDEINDGKGPSGSADTTYSYIVDNPTNPTKFCLDGGSNGQYYQMGSTDRSPKKGACNLLGGDTTVEKTGNNEFATYADLAPIFDTYGLRQYTISFDIKSANTSTQPVMVVYSQNGNGARYNFYVNITVSESYKRRSITVTPTVADLSLSESTLSFYGTYNTGNIPTIKNVKVEFGDTATDWTPGFQ